MGKPLWATPCAACSSSSTTPQGDQQTSTVSTLIHSRRHKSQIPPPGSIFNRPGGGAAQFLDWFQLIKPRLSRYSMGLREPRDILIRFSLYQRMYSCTARMNTSMVVDFQSRG